MKANEISQFFDDLKMEADGIHRATEFSSKHRVSYPKDGSPKMATLEERSFWFRHRLDCILDLVKRFPGNGPFFDIGGGNGFVSLGIKSLDIDAVLIEPGGGASSLARGRGIDTVIQASFIELKTKNNSLTRVGLFDVLEHIENDLEFLNNLNCKMISGGRLFITVPAGQYLWSGEDVYAGHFRRYSKKDLIQKLEKTGFSVEYSSPIFFSLVLPLFFLRTVPSFVKKNLRCKLRWFSLQNRDQSEHLVDKGAVRAMVSLILYIERLWLKRGWPLPWGTSFLIVAQKV